MSAPRFERDDVLHQLRPSAVLDRFGVRARRAGSELRTKQCPQCGPRSRESVAVNATTGRWIDHAHGCCGDAFDLVAGFAGLDVRSQFTKVIALAAEIAGVEVVPVDRAHDAVRRAEQARREVCQRDEAAEAAARRERSIASATASWEELAAHSAHGERYLATRTVADVVAHGLVRFTENGDPAIALRTADARIVNIVRRRRLGGEPKVFGLKGCPNSGTFGDSIADITHRRDVVLVEGMFDTLTARIAWPDAVVLGAHGAGNIPKIAAAAAKRIQLARARLLLVPHRDEAGAAAMITAGKVAIAAGLRLGARLWVIDCGAKDLNDAWRAGWRPQ